MKEQNQNEINYVPSKYSRNLNSYTKSELPTVLPFVNAICRSCEYGPAFPVHNVMKAVVKLFMLNQIQTIFLAYLIKETKWNIKEKIIYLNADSVRDIICVALDNIQYKCLILYLMVCSYTVKFYLNEEAEEALDEAHRVCPSFRTIFEHWAKKHNHLTSRISPRLLNRVYKELYLSSRSDEKDFNRMVDAIIQISPAYNPERDKKKTEQAKTLKHVTVVPLSEEKTENSGFINPGPMSIPLFSSSGFLHLINANYANTTQGSSQSGIYNENGSNNSFINYMAKSRQRPRQSSFLGMFNSSFGGMPHNLSLKDDEEQCEELMIGLEDGHSQENIYFVNGNIANNTHHKGLGNSQVPEDMGPFTSVITLNKGISFTDRCINPSHSAVMKEPKD